MRRVTYSIVIATRNRNDALSLSLPLFLKQSRLPDAIYLVDSSDDSTPNEKLVADISRQTDIPLHYETSEAGAVLQRNKGLQHVKSDITFLPDDDSLVYPGCMETMMQVYDLDLEGKVGGVCPAEANKAPEGVLDRDDDTAYAMNKTDKIKAFVGETRYKVEARYFRDLHQVADTLYQDLGISSVNDEVDIKADNAIYVPWMTGFRMSFRTEVIRKSLFNSNLGRYSLFEDVDASFNCLKTHSLIGARNAQIYHHKSPQKRANGRAFGAMQVLNRAYIIARTGKANKKVQSLFRRYASYKILQYIVSSNSDYGRERLAGARDAFKLTNEIFNAPLENLDAVYRIQRAKCIFSDD